MTNYTKAFYIKHIKQRQREIQKKLSEERLIAFLGGRNWRKTKIKGQKGSYYAVDDGHIYNESGKEIGCIDSQGYVVTLNAKVHRLIWEAFNGKIPEGFQIDHINTIRNDNRLENLRLVTPKENCNNPLTIEHYKQSNKGKGINKKQYIGEFYDASLTDKENIKVMKENGLEISLGTIKRWRKENNITKYKAKHKSK